MLNAASSGVLRACGATWSSVIACTLLAGEAACEEVALPLGKEATCRVEYFTPSAATGTLVLIVAAEPVEPGVAERVRTLPAHVLSLQFDHVPTVDGLSEALVAAAAFGEKAKGCDATRLGLVSFGRTCAATIKATQRNPSLVRALALIAPEEAAPRVNAQLVHPWPGVRTRIVAPKGSAAAHTIKRAINFESRDDRLATGRGEDAIEAACEMLDNALADLIDFRVPVLGSVPGDPFEMDNMNVAPRFIYDLHRGGAHRTVAGIRYRIVIRQCGPPALPWDLMAVVERPGEKGPPGYRGDIRLTIGSRVVTFKVDSNDESPEDVELKGVVGGEDTTVDGTCGVRSDPGRRWLTVGLDPEPWKLEGASVVVEFLPEKGSVVRLPATGAFQLRPYRYAIRRIDMKFWNDD